MTSSFDIIIGGTSADDFDVDIVELEVEENADLPGAFAITLPVALNDDDYDTISDSRLAPLSNIAITAQASDGKTHCLIDGYVLAQQAHLDTGSARSTLKVWGQDASWLMNTKDKAKEWPDVTDANVANEIFDDYGITPDPANLDDDDGPTHTSDGATLMQRATDAQFLRSLARRSGKLFRVFCDEQPGQRTGYFAMPDLDADPVLTLVLNDDAAANVTTLDISFDVMRPSAVSAYQALFTDQSGDDTGAGGTVDDDGLPDMDARGLAEVATDQGAVTAMLTTTAADADTLTQRSNALLRDAGWFVRCQGITDTDLLGAILRVGTIVELSAAGALYSGNYLVWNVRHRITAHKHEMNFVLVRNALGRALQGVSL
jgi:hypothetical protein